MQARGRVLDAREKADEAREEWEEALLLYGERSVRVKHAYARCVWLLKLANDASVDARVTRLR